MRRPEPPQLRAHGHRLVHWQRLALYIVSALVTCTGVAWLFVHYTLGAGVGELPHPLEVWSMRLHGLGAFGGLFVLGLLTAAHVPQGWRLSRRQGWAGQRISGLVLCVMGGMLAVSGYLLYYFAPEPMRPALGWAHAATGVVMGVLLAVHRRGVHTRFALAMNAPTPRH